MWEYGARAGPGIPSIPGSSFTSRLCGRLSYRPIILEAWRQEGKGGKKGMKEREKKRPSQSPWQPQARARERLVCKTLALNCFVSERSVAHTSKGAPNALCLPLPKSVAWASIASQSQRRLWLNSAKEKNAPFTCTGALRPLSSTLHVRSKVGNTGDEKNRSSNCTV